MGHKPRNHQSDSYIVDIEPTDFDLAASPFNCWHTTCIRDLQIARLPRDNKPTPPVRSDVLLTLRKNDKISRQIIFWGERTMLNGEPYIMPYKVRADSRLVLPYNSKTDMWADLVCVEKNKMSGHLELEIVYIGALIAVKYLARNYDGEFLPINAVRGSWTSRPFKFDYEVSQFLEHLPSILSVALLNEYSPIPTTQ